MAAKKFAQSISAAVTRTATLIVYFPELKVIHTGDLFLARRAPRGGAAQTRPPGVNIYVDYAQGGSFMEWTRTLDGALQLDFDTVIPGHGPVSTKDDVVKFRVRSRNDEDTSHRHRAQQHD